MNSDVRWNVPATEHSRYPRPYSGLLPRTVHAFSMNAFFSLPRSPCGPLAVVAPSKRLPH